MGRKMILISSLFFYITAYAQEITITGKVTSNGEVLPGVSVVVKGQNRGTVTSIDGGYKIQMQREQSLIFSFIGYETTVIPIENRTVVNVELKETSQLVDEVVITVPYGTARK